jgi:hypothetical protein
VAIDKDKKRAAKGNNQIVIKIDVDNYDAFLSNRKKAREIILSEYVKNSQLFPKGIENFTFNGTNKESGKMGLKKRQIIVNGIYYQIHPSFILSDMRGKVSDGIVKGLTLCAHGTPYWLVVMCFGRNEAFWYRLVQSFSRNSIVGATVYSQHPKIPENILVDEKHIKVGKQKRYVATTIGKGCYLGAEVARKANEEELTKSYSVFKNEANDLNPEYYPKSINTDGWQATLNAMAFLFPLSILIRCFLHAFLKIRTEAKRKFQEEFDSCANFVWDCYRSENKRSFSQRIRRLKEWTEVNMQSIKMKEAVMKFCDRKKEFARYFDNPNAHRTSNMLDRLMKLMDRKIFKAQGFHGSLEAANTGMRSFALLHNFAPSCPASRENGHKSPAERLNGFAFSDNWVENLLIASSMNGKKKNTLL